MGVQVNPAFVSAFNNLKAAHQRMDATKGTNAYVAAENAMHDAENVWCNLPGIIDGGNLTQSQAEAMVNNYMNQVHSWYV